MVSVKLHCFFQYPVSSMFCYCVPWPWVLFFQYPAFIQYLSFFYRMRDLRAELIQRLDRLEIATKRGPIDCACVRESIASHAAIRDFCSRKTGNQYQTPSSLTSAKQGHKRGRGGRFRKKENSNQNQNQEVQGHTRRQSYEHPHNVSRSNGRSREDSRS